MPTRGAELNERLTALRALWTHADFEFYGEHVDFDSIVSSPRPSVPVPIYVRGSRRNAQNQRPIAGHGPRPHPYRLNQAD